MARRMLQFPSRLPSDVCFLSPSLSLPPCSNCKESFVHCSNWSMYGCSIGGVQLFTFHIRLSPCFALSLSLSLNSRWIDRCAFQNSFLFFHSFVFLISCLIRLLFSGCF